MDSIELFKLLSGKIRLRCVSLLMKHGELCVCELTEALDLPQPKISHNLASLRKSGLVSDRKQGLWVYYQINPDLPEWVKDILKASIIGTSDKQPFNKDSKQLILIQK